MTENDLPLFDLFTRLRESGLPLGIGEYQLVLRALQVGFGIPDQAALGRLCRLLWVKSTEESRVFDYHFSEVMKAWQDQIELPSQPKKPKVAPRITINPLAPIPIPEPVRPNSPPPEDTNWVMQTDDEVQAAQSVVQLESDFDGVINTFGLEDEYFPVTRRQMKQSWRYLRRPIREGPRVELDMDATISRIERQGMLLEPVLIPRRINRAELVLMIDHEGSMVPFNLLANRLVETAMRGGRLKSADVYYFHNYPVQYLYRDPSHQNAQKIQDVLGHYYHERAGALIFSDAGAARGGLNLDRIRWTRLFLNSLRLQFRYLVWLNPVPRSRWSGTTANILSDFVPMFDVSRKGLDNAISVLRGRPVRIEV
jgi:uncharacterized protein